MAVLTFGHQMVKPYKLNFIKSTRLYLMYSLVFLLLALTYSCKQHNEKLAVVWNGGNAIGIQIPKYLLADSETSTLKIILASGKGTPILGKFNVDGDMVMFSPLIPLSTGLDYQVLQGDKLLGTLNVPIDTNEKKPEVVKIYPQVDTLPINALKLYIEFSKPMRTGRVLDHINLLHGKDTMHNVFLDLEPELWDSTGKVLTLWIDPGRIKRGLVLNKELGNPLTNKDHYTFTISPDWKDSKGVKLGKQYTKTFIAGARDSQIPDINKWRFNIPQAKSQATLMINLGEPLDHFLLMEAVTILDAKGKPVDGFISTGNYDRELQFSPRQPWAAQRYTLRVNAKLEDVASNNLNRVFDRDMKQEVRKDNVYYERYFNVKP